MKTLPTGRFAKEEFKGSNTSVKNRSGFGLFWVFCGFLLCFVCLVFIFLSLALSCLTKFFRIILILLFLLTPREVSPALLKSNYDIVLIISLIGKDHK